MEVLNSCFMKLYAAAPASVVPARNPKILLPSKSKPLAKVPCQPFICACVVGGGRGGMWAWMAKGTHPERKAPTGLRAGSAAASVASLLDVWKPRAPSARPARSILGFIVTFRFRSVCFAGFVSRPDRNRSGL